MLKLKLVILLSFISIYATAQTREVETGIYLTATDFIKHKLSYQAEETNTRGSKVYLHQFFNGSSVTVVSGDKNLTLLKSQIFGYRDNRQDYRFFENRSYEIVDTSGFYIYSYEKLVHQIKGLKPVKAYFFSVPNNGEILPLTIEDLDMKFAGNKKFRYAVQATFKTDNELMAYDKPLKAYKLKEIYKDNLKY